MLPSRPEDRSRSLLAVGFIWLAAFAARAYGDCGPPPDISHAVLGKDVTNGSFPIGSTVTYVCNAAQGYGKVAGKTDTISCQEDSSWSTIAEFCELGCGVPPRFEIGQLMEKYLDTDFFPVGISVMYTCRPGYVLKARAQRTIKCLESLTWSKTQEFCQRKDCGNPGEPQNGNVEVTLGDSGYPDTKFGSEATFSCHTGFRLIGKGTRMCTASGWSSAVPICEPVLCGEPPNIANGKHTGYGQEEFYYLSGVSYRCEADWFELIGSNSLHCTETGAWSADAPICKDRRCPEPEVENGRKVSGFKHLYLYQDEVKFRCNEGFKLSDPRPLRCTEDNKWHPMPVCQPVICERPPAIVNGTHSGHRDQEVFKYHERVTYRCNSEELSLIGINSIQCIGEGFWSQPTPICKVVLCENPLIENGRKTSDSGPPYRYESTVTFVCDPYFRLKGRSPIVCREDSKWRPPVPTCERVSCSQPSVTNSKQTSVRSDLYGIDTNAKFECNPGYVMNGSNTAYCKSDFQWRPPLPTCIPRVSCLPPVIPNGDFLPKNAMKFQSGLEEGYEVSKQLEISCNHKHVIKVSRTIICGEDLTWNVTAQACVPRKTCLQPNISNGHITSATTEILQSEIESGYKPYTAITIGCDPGYRLKGKNSLTCSWDLDWDQKEPTCALIICPKQKVNNGEIIEKCRGKPILVEGYRLNDTVEVRCLPGYALKGQRESQCQENSKWSTTPVCEAVVCRELEVNNGRLKLINRQKRFWSNYRFGDVVEVQCAVDHRLIGPKIVSCKVDSTWSASPKCELVRCDEPWVLKGSIVCQRIKEPALTNGYRPLDRVTFQCDRGFIMNGTREIQCKADSKWSALPTCEPDIQYAPRFLPLAKHQLNYTEDSGPDKDTEITTSSKELCKLVMKSIDEKWGAMNKDDKYSHLQIRKLCQENAELQNRNAELRILTREVNATSLPVSESPKPDTE